MRITFNFRYGLSPLTLELEGDEATLLAQVEDALENGTLLKLTDIKGERVMIPGSEVSYVLIPSESHRPVGFGRQ